MRAAQLKAFGPSWLSVACQESKCHAVSGHHSLLFSSLLLLAYQNNYLQGLLFVYGLGLGQGLCGWLAFTGKYRADADGFSVTDLTLQFSKKFGCPGEKKRKLSNNVFIPVLPSFCILWWGRRVSILGGYFVGLLWNFLLQLLFSLLVTLLWIIPLTAYSFERITRSHDA